MKQPVPSRSWKMNDKTKKWVICGHSPGDQASLLTQIAEAEQQRKMSSSRRPAAITRSSIGC
jgi:hypothetical protein